MTDEELREHIKALAQNAGSYPKLVEQLNLPYHPTHIGSIARGQHHVPNALLRALGLKRVVRYLPIEETTPCSCS